MNAQDRRIRSFVRREGRITRAQQQALTADAERCGLPDGNERIDLDALFGRQAARRLEIGFGNGANLVHMAANDPESDFIGLEVHRPGLGSALAQIAQQELSNVRVAGIDAVELLRDRLAPNSLDEIWLLFPDPWHKKRHHKRRLLQPEFCDLVAGVLKPGGRFRLATDWENYAEQMREVLDAHAAFAGQNAEDGWAPRASERILTRFEQRGLRLGHVVHDLCYCRANV